MSTQTKTEPAKAKTVVGPAEAVALPSANATPAAAAAPSGEQAASVKVAYFTKFMNVREVITFADKSKFSFPTAHFHTADPELIANLREAAKAPQWRINEVVETKEKEQSEKSN